MADGGWERPGKWVGYVNDLQTDGQELPGRLYKRPAGREREGAFWNTHKHNACNVIGLRFLTYSMAYDIRRRRERSCRLRLGCEMK